MLSVQITNRVSPAYQRAASLLSDGARAEANQAMGEEVQLAVVAHVRGLAQSRHDTASRLGASPTGFLAGAAEAAAEAGVVRTDSEGVSLSIRHPAIARAFRDIQIFPKNAQALAIPVHRIAYGRRPAELWYSLPLFSAKGMIFMQQGYNQPPLALYALVRSVTQRQDRSLMPNDDEILDAAATGLRRYIRGLMTA